MWHNESRLFYPSVLAAEQCSSERTAIYKQRLVKSDDILCDLTGGLGVDLYFFSQKVRHVIYVEKENEYCDAVQYNMNILGASNVCVVNSDAIELVISNDSSISEANVFYIDPARRGISNKRMFAINDCEPDITKIWNLLPGRREENKEILSSIAEVEIQPELRMPVKIIVKLSPMLDLNHVLSQLPGIDEVHVLSVKNECKELLIVASNADCSDSGLLKHKASFSQKNEAEIICVNYTTAGAEQSFRFKLSEEHSAPISFVEKTGKNLYEPNTSILKAGAYKSVALRFEIGKLNVNSHLYSSDNLISSFPGRIFEIMEVIPFNNRTSKTLAAIIPQANITVRNFPLSVEELRKRLRICDGGEIFLFATTLQHNKKVLIKCCKVCSVTDVG